MEVFAPARAQSIPACRSEDDSCPQCKSGRYLNRNMKLLASPCYHRMCEECVSNRFDAGPAPCPECHRFLRKIDFYQPVFEDLTVENEVRIRQRLSMTFNKRREEFKGATDYDAYLEMVEDLVLGLLHEEDAGEIDRRIERYKRENQSSISKNQAKQKREDKIFEVTVLRERERRQQRRDEDQQLLEDEKRKKAEIKQNLINELATSDRDAKEIERKTMAQLKKSSLRNRAATRGMRADLDALLGAVDDGFGDDDDMDEDEAEAAPFDPAESPYAPMLISLRSRYDDPNPALRQPT
ncbi:TFIIH/NER complex subunit, partial [Coemansia helicoidea]